MSNQTHVEHVTPKNRVRELAEIVAAVIAHPDAPVGLRESITRFMDELTSYQDHDGAQFIEQSLLGYINRQERGDSALRTAADTPDRDEQGGEDAIVGAHLAALLDSPHTPEDVRRRLSEFLGELFSAADVNAEDAKMLPITYPLALSRLFAKTAK
jgi:hypothetical protein